MKAIIRAALTATVVLASCGGGQTSRPKPPAEPAGQVLPVSDNPIANTATAESLTIDSVLVENNVDPTTGKDADDHLEIAVTNSSGAELTGFEVFYTVEDATAGVSESYYAKLPAGFSVAPGAQRVIHFDGSGQPDHFPVNQYGLFSTSKNAMNVTVIVSAATAAPQTVAVAKDAGGAENPDE